MVPIDQFDHGRVQFTVPEGDLSFDIDCHSVYKGRLVSVGGGIFWGRTFAPAVYLGRLSAMRFELPMRLVEAYFTLFPLTSAHDKAHWVLEAGKALNLLPVMASGFVEALNTFFEEKPAPFMLGRPKKEQECQAPKELPNGTRILCKRKKHHSGPHTCGPYTWRDYK